MAKLTLAPLASLTNQTSAMATINNNSDLIEAAIENTISRDGTSPNTMGASLDMNSNRIINLPPPINDSEPARYVDLLQIVNGGDSGNFVTVDGSQTLTNKSIDLDYNTITGTTAEFNTALSDNDFATLAGTETLTNKTLTTPRVSTVLVNAGANTVTFPLSTDTLVGKSTADVLINKSIDLTNNTLVGTTAQFNTALSDNNFATVAGAEALTGKTINLASNTLTGTTAEFNTALTDNDFATLAGAEALTNKTITNPVVTTGTFATPALATPAITAATFAAGTAAAGTAPIKLTAGTNLTAVEAGAVEYDGAVPYITLDATTPRRNFVDTSSVVMASAALTGQNIATVQPWFPSPNTASGVNVTAGTNYILEAVLLLTRAAGVTSHTTAIGFNSGTATLTSFTALYTASTTAGGNVLTAASTIGAVAATSLVVTAASIVATESIYVQVRGEFRVNAAGTFIPNFTYSAIPGGVPTIVIGSYMKVTPIGVGAISGAGSIA